MHKIFPQLRSARIDYEWAAVSASWSTVSTVIGRLRANVYCALAISTVNMTHAAGETLRRRLAVPWKTDPFERIGHPCIPFNCAQPAFRTLMASRPPLIDQYYPAAAMAGSANRPTSPASRIA